MGHLTLGAPLRPLVPVLSCEVQSSYTFRRASDRRDGCRKMGVKASLVMQNAPGDSSELVCQRDRKLEPVHAGVALEKPCAEAEPRPEFLAHQDDPRRLDEKHA